MRYYCPTCCGLIRSGDAACPICGTALNWNRRGGKMYTAAFSQEDTAPVLRTGGKKPEMGKRILEIILGVLGVLGIVLAAALIFCTVLLLRLLLRF